MESEITDDKKKNPKRPNTTGTVAAEDLELSLWLGRIWARGEVPERVELWQCFGRNQSVRGQRIYYEPFKPNEKLDSEKANKVANEIIEAAQNDAEVLRRAVCFEIAIVNRNQGATPLVRRLGPVQPKRALLVDGSLPDGEEEDLPTGKSLALTYAQESLQAVRWERSRNDRVLGEVIAVLMRRLEGSESNIDRLMSKVMSFFEAAQTAMDRGADREFSREREKFKLEMWRDGWRTARNLVPGLFADKGGTKALPEGETKARVEPERMLIDNFLTDVERSEGLMIKLFGDWDTTGEKAVLKTPGVFTAQQYAVLEGVRQGKLPVERLEHLMPKSGHDLEITEKQIESAMAAGVTEGMGSALLELVGLVAKRKAESEKEKQP